MLRLQLLLTVVAASTLPQNAIEQHGITKLGTVDFNLVETSPLIWHGRLLRLESIRPSYVGNKRADKQPYFRLRDISAGNYTAGFGAGFSNQP